MLNGNHKPGKLVISHASLVVQRPDRVEVLGRHREHRHVLNVRIALQRVARAMMHVVSGGPPGDTHAVAQITDD